MRRLLPWALVGLIGLGTGLGAALGVAGSPTTSSPAVSGPEAQQWLTGVLAATKGAGTAHLDDAEITTSPNPEWRGSASGSGVVDFATGSFHVSEADREFQESSQNGGPTQRSFVTDDDADIAVGSTLYERFGNSGNFVGWTTVPGGPRKGELGLASASGFGMALTNLTGSVTAITVRNLGPAAVGGNEATRYLVRTRARPACPGHKPPIASTIAWVDARGRMVQARVSYFFNGRFTRSFLHAQPGLAHVPMGSRTFTDTLRFSAFGEPVHIARPALARGSETSAIGVTGGGSVSNSCG